MKYIRTQEGIAEDAGTDALGLRCVRYKRYKVVLSQEDDVIVKEADTIEELCDLFIVENPERTIHKGFRDCIDALDWVVDMELPIGIKDFDERRHLASGKNDWKVYGAIWTDKGLIYVTKMNEKEEWELLWN